MKLIHRKNSIVSLHGTLPLVAGSNTRYLVQTHLAGSISMLATIHTMLIQGIHNAKLGNFHAIR